MRRRFLLTLMALATLAAGCNSPPKTRVLLQASKLTVEAGGTVLLTATVTADGKAVVAQSVTFSASEGTFTGSPDQVTDANGQAFASLQVDAVGGIMTEVTATAVEAGKNARLTIQVESGGGGGTPPER